MANPKKRVISISFKEEESWLYETLIKYSSPTGTIKDVLKQHFGGMPKLENPVNGGKISAESDSIIDIF